MEVRRGQLVEGWVGHVYVEALRLADEGGASTGQVDERFLGDLPDRLVEVLEVLGKSLDFLDTSIVSH